MNPSVSIIQKRVLKVIQIMGTASTMDLINVPGIRSIGHLHATVSELESQGFILTWLVQGDATRKFYAKKTCRLTENGTAILQEERETINESIG